MKLEEIEKLCKETTPGPWSYDNMSCVCSKDGLIAELRGIDDIDRAAKFIAASRELIPKMAAALRAAENFRMSLYHSVNEDLSSITDGVSKASDQLYTKMQEI